MKQDWAFVVIAGIAVMAILLTVPIAVDAAKSSLFWEPLGGAAAWGPDDPILCPINFTNIGTAFVNLEQIQFQLDANPTVKGLQPLTYPIAEKLAPGDSVVIEFPFEDTKGDPIEIDRAFLVSVTAEEVGDSTRGTGEPKTTKTVSNKTIKP